MGRAANTGLTGSYLGNQMRAIVFLQRGATLEQELAGLEEHMAEVVEG